MSNSYKFFGGGQRTATNTVNETAHNRPFSKISFEKMKRRKFKKVSNNNIDDLKPKRPEYGDFSDTEIQKCMLEKIGLDKLFRMLKHRKEDLDKLMVCYFEFNRKWLKLLGSER